MGAKLRGLRAPCEFMIFEKKPGDAGCGPRVLQNAAAEVSKITQKHTKTHKYTEIKKLFLFVKGGNERWRWDTKG